MHLHHRIVHFRVCIIPINRFQRFVQLFDGRIKSWSSIFHAQCPGRSIQLYKLVSVLHPKQSLLEFELRQWLSSGNVRFSTFKNKFTVMMQQQTNATHQQPKSSQAHASNQDSNPSLSSLQL